MFSKEFKIGNYVLNETSKPFVIAEISANHNGNINKAKELIRAASDCGADAVKLQTYTPDTMTIDSDKDDFFIKGGLWDGYTLYNLYKEAHTPYDWHEELFDLAANLNIICISTPFDETAVDLLHDLNCPAIKIASFEVTDLPLLESAALLKKPMIISTGMANEDDISLALNTIQKHGNQELCLLHCVSGYPTPFDQYNISTINLLKEKFNCMVGLSDHTLDTEVSVASVALGAKIIEKHFTLDRDDKGPDSEFSLEPRELQKLVKEVENAWKSLGFPSLEKKEVEKENLRFRRSIYISNDIRKGELHSADNIRRIRPGFGLEPRYFSEVIGKRASKDLFKGDPLTFQDFE